MTLSAVFFLQANSNRKKIYAVSDLPFAQSFFLFSFSSSFQQSAEIEGRVPGSFHAAAEACPSLPSLSAIKRALNCRSSTSSSYSRSIFIHRATSQREKRKKKESKNTEIKSKGSHPAHANKTLYDFEGGPQGIRSIRAPLFTFFFA